MWSRNTGCVVYRLNGIQDNFFSYLLRYDIILEIYYLENGRYVLEQSYMLQEDKEEEDYNADTEICLKAFPHIKMTLGEIFEGVN